MIDVEAALARIEAAGVRVIKDAKYVIHIPGESSGEIADIIRYKLAGKRGRFESVLGLNAYGAARFAGWEGDEETDAVGDAILTKYSRIVFVPPIKTDETEPWLIFTLDEG